MNQKNLKDFSREMIDANFLKVQKNISKLQTSITNHNKELEEKYEKLAKLENELKQIEQLKQQMLHIFWL